MWSHCCPGGHRGYTFQLHMPMDRLIVYDNVGVMNYTKHKYQYSKFKERNMVLNEKR